MREIVASAPGKINLLLRSGKLREDGFHPLTTVFEAVSLREYVVARTRRSPGVRVETIVYRPPTEFTTGGDPIFDREMTGRFGSVATEKHLAVQAAKALQPLAAATSWGATSSGVHLQVHKTIPIGGGMAGGSADAAATLIALNEMWSLALSEEQLLAVGRRLGADVPACLMGGLTVGFGKGDEVHRLNETASGDKHWWALAFDERGLSTPAVFTEFDRLGLGADTLPSTVGDAGVLTGPSNLLGDALHNDLQAAAVSLRPALERRGRVALDAGALAWVVSGSGPTVAALASDRSQAETVCAAWLGQPGVAGVAVTFGPGARAQLEKRLPGWVNSPPNRRSISP